MTDIIKHFDDLFFSVVAQPHSHHVDFIVYDITGTVPEEGLRCYDSPGDRFLTDIEQALPYLHGFVKWDGCSNWVFDQQERVMLHGCCRSNITRFGEVLGRCFDWAAELMSEVWFGE